MSTESEAIVEAARDKQDAEAQEHDVWLFFRRRRGKHDGKVVMRTALADIPQWLIDGVQDGSIVARLEPMRDGYRVRLK